MPLMHLFKRREPSAAAGAPSPDAVVQARSRARRRLIGATVLLAVGVVGFPLLFESQPRPIPIDIPIEIPRKDAAPPLALPPSRQDPAPLAKSPPAPAAVPEPAPTATAAPPPAAASATATVMEPRPARPADAPGAGADDGKRAQALLEGRSPGPAKPSEESPLRIVVQVGAYSEADKLREARQRVEQLGLKTYTQVIEADGARRTRVRVGPFASRDEAEKAAARIKAAGLPTAILTL